MTAIHEGVAPAEVTNDQVEYEQPLTEAQQRRQQICRELGKMVPLGEVVKYFRVEGWNHLCSPVRGKIIVATSTTPEGDDLAERTVHPTNAREAIADLSIFADLNELGAQWRAGQFVPAPPTQFHDAGRN